MSQKTDFRTVDLDATEMALTELMGKTVSETGTPRPYQKHIKGPLNIGGAGAKSAVKTIKLLRQTTNAAAVTTILEMAETEVAAFMQVCAGIDFDRAMADAEYAQSVMQRANVAMRSGIACLMVVDTAPRLVEALASCVEAQTARALLPPV